VAGSLVETHPGVVETRIGRQVLADLRWSFTRPWHWLSGVAVNLVLSLLWLAAAPLTGRPHHDWAIIVGSYFATFILADVTTTNVLGADAPRVRRSLRGNTPLRRILLVKNITLLTVVALPTLVATGVITVLSEADYRLVLTLPGVAFPILTWLGVGNLISVLLPVAPQRLRQRWERRRELKHTVRWLVAISLPYALCSAIGPVGRVPRIIQQSLGVAPSLTATRGLLVLLTGIAFWAVGTAAALAVVRYRALRFDDEPREPARN
jgi:hypothetical protein